MKAIVFDLDGTLVDSAPEIQAAVNTVLAEDGHPLLSLDTIVFFIGHGLGALVQSVVRHLELDPAQYSALLQRVTAAYTATGGALTGPYPGVVQALEHLTALGHPMGVCTNKPRPLARATLAELGLAQFFDVVIGGDSLPQRKPDPAPLHATFSALNTKSGVFVGDTEVDAETAQRAGIPLLLFTQGYRKSPVGDIPHSAVFDGFDELPALVASMTA